jgi:riboflavin kinase
MKPIVEEKIHLNDLSFIHLCIENSGINKGIYNTIDTWFYKQGVTNILDRRTNILSFLEFLNRKNKNTQSSKKFGSGGLTVNLQEYFLRNKPKRSFENSL